MIDPYENKAFIPCAIHRFGNSFSGLKDNTSLGGISALIDVRTGQLTRAVNYTVDEGLNWYEYHPVSKQKIFGEIIPNWDFVKESIEKIANKIPYIKYAGWDIIVTDEHIWILEANNAPGMNTIQVHQPYSQIPKAWRFFQHHGFFK